MDTNKDVKEKMNSDELIRMKKKRRFRNFLFGIIFLLGFLILMYPIISRLYYNVESGYEINNFDDESKKLPSEELQRRIKLAKAFNDSLVNHIDNDPYTEEEKSAGRKEYARMLEINEKMGHVEIPKIKQDLPIYAGTSEEVLQKGVGHLEGSSLPIGGNNTHTVLTAHCGLPTAKLFTDLEKLEQGDVFYIHNIEGTLAYKVVQIEVVLPTEFDDLLIVPNKDYATLLTCTPYMINTHRLFVRGERIPYEEAVNIPVVPDDTVVYKYRDYFYISLGVILILILLVLYTRRKKNRYRRGIKSLMEAFGESKESEDKEPSILKTESIESKDYINEDSTKTDSDLKDKVDIKENETKDSDYSDSDKVSTIRGGEDMSFFDKLKNLMIEPDEDDIDDEDLKERRNLKRSENKTKRFDDEGKIRSGIKGWGDDSSPEEEVSEINVPIKTDEIERKSSFDDEKLKKVTEERLSNEESNLQDKLVKKGSNSTPDIVTKTIESKNNKIEKELKKGKAGSFFERFSKKKAQESMFDGDINIDEEARRREAKRLARDAEARIDREKAELKKKANFSNKNVSNEATERINKAKERASKIDSMNQEELIKEYNKIREASKREVQNIEIKPSNIDDSSEVKNVNFKDLISKKPANNKKETKRDLKEEIKNETRLEETMEVKDRIPRNTYVNRETKVKNPQNNSVEVKKTVAKNVDSKPQSEVQMKSAEVIKKSVTKNPFVEQKKQYVKPKETEEQKNARLKAEEFDKMMKERAKNRREDKSMIDIKLSQEESRLRKLQDLFNGDDN